MKEKAQINMSNWKIYNDLAIDTCKNNYCNILKHLLPKINKITFKHNKEIAMNIPLAHVSDINWINLMRTRKISEGLQAIEYYYPDRFIKHRKLRSIIDLGLGKYVYAHWGIPDPWFVYSFYPIGLLLSYPLINSNNLEKKSLIDVKKYNLSYRDYLSEEYWFSGEKINLLKGFEMVDLLLHPDSAYDIIAVDATYNGTDFWDYWGNPKNRKLMKQLIENHTKRIEFHSINRIGNEFVKVIIYPLIKTRTRNEFISMKTRDLNLEYLSNIFENAQFYFYEFDNNPILNFLKESFRIVKHLIDEGEFPPC